MRAAQRLNRIIDRYGVGDIGDKDPAGETETLLRLFEGFASTPYDRDPHSLIGQRRGNGGPDPASPSGDQRVAAVQNRDV